MTAYKKGRIKSLDLSEAVRSLFTIGLSGNTTHEVVLTPSDFRLQKITSGALGFELAAVAILGCTILSYDYYSSRDSGYY
jgi:hypothetical protein